MELSLDEIIQSKRKTNKPRPSTNIPIRRGRINKRNSAPLPMPRTWNNNTNKPWEHDMFRGNRNNNQQNMRSGAKIQISNLDFGVNDEDINELFKEFGSIIKAGIHFDRSGRSLGTAEVTYANKACAIMARNKYNGIPLDNKPMKIVMLELNNPNNGLGSRIQIPAQRQRPASVRRVPNRPSFEKRPSFGNRTNAGPKRNQKVPKTKEQLDAEMDEYLSKGN